NDPSLLYKAEEGARQALRVDSACSVAHSALAHIYLLVGRKELVPGEVDKALQSNPHDPAVHLVLACYHLANGDYREATRKLKQIATEFPTFGPARAFLGQVQREQGDSSALIREMERVLEVDQDTPFGYWNLGRAYMDSGELPKARQSLEHVGPQ